MKKRRRIEITTFRSRTIITVRNQPSSALVEKDNHADTSDSAPANVLQAEDGVPNSTQVAQSLPTGLARIKGDLK